MKKWLVTVCLLIATAAWSAESALTGVLLLSFDDRNFTDWENALPIFARYRAHVTFFVNGSFDEEAMRTVKKLVAAGHAIGLHGEHHANVPPTIAKMGTDGYYAYDLAKPRGQCEAAGIPVRNFAYPNCMHDAASDSFLLTKFDRLRATVPGLRPYDPTGAKRGTLKPLLEESRLFVPTAELPKLRIIESPLLGEAYDTDIAEVIACIRRAGKNREMISFTSHGISPDAHGINLKTAWLEVILKATQKYGVRVLSYKEIPLS